MKAYLSDNYQNILTNYYGNKAKQAHEEAHNNVNKKQHIKLTNENSKYISQIYQAKERSLKSDSQSVSIKTNRHHTRTHTEEITEYKSKESKIESKDLNKTYSKNYLRSEIHQTNPETKRTARTKPYEQTNFLNMVKNRLNSQNNNKKVCENVNLNKLIALAKKSKEISYKQQQQNIKEEQKGSNTKNLHLLMKQQVQNVCFQFSNNEKSSGNAPICQLLRVMTDNIMQLSKDKEKQVKIIKVVRQLQQKNVKLLTLINNLKKKGIDVDSYWVNSSF